MSGPEEMTYTCEDVNITVHRVEGNATPFQLNVGIPSIHPEEEVQLERVQPDSLGEKSGLQVPGRVQLEHLVNSGSCSHCSRQKHWLQLKAPPS